MFYSNLVNTASFIAGSTRLNISLLAAGHFAPNLTGNYLIRLGQIA